MRTTLALASLALAVLLAAPERADACGPMYNLSPFEIEQALSEDVDETPPAKPVVLRGEVEGRTEESAAGCGAEPACGGPAVVVELEPPGEHEGQVGWIFRVVGGKAPREDFVPEHAVVPEYGTVISFGYPGEEPVDMTLEVVAIDRSGNRSEPATVRIREEGAGGCSAAAGRPLPFLVIFALLGLRRRALRVA